MLKEMFLFILLLTFIFKKKVLQHSESAQYRSYLKTTYILLLHNLLWEKKAQ